MRWPPDRHLYDILRHELRSRGLGTGPWEGAEATLVAPQLARLLDETLAKEVNRINPDELLGWAATFLAESQGSRYDLALVNDQDAMAKAVERQRLTDLAGSARVLLEHAVRNRGVSRRRVDPVLNDRLQNLADQTWRAHVAATRGHFRISTISRVALTRPGRLEFLVRDALPFRMSAMDRTSVRRMAMRRDAQNDDLGLARHIVGALEGRGQLPEEFKPIDDALRACRGFGLVEMVGAFVALAQLSGGTQRELAGVSFRAAAFPAEFRAQVEHSLPAVNSREVALALPYMTWTQDALQGSRLAMSDYQEVPARLLSRPILERPDGGLFIANTAPAFALHTFIVRLLEGTWFEELTAGDELLRRALEARRNRIRPIHGFEREVARELRAAGFNHVVNVDVSSPGKASAVGVPIRREIDAIVVLPNAWKIYVIEAKDLAYPYSPRRVRSELDKYTRERGHFERLSGKVADIQSDPSVVAQSIGCPPGDYSTTGIFVTRELSPAAFLDDAPFRSVLLDDLVSSLDSATN